MSPGIIDSSGLYTTTDDGEAAVIATIGAISQPAAVSVKTYAPASAEFYIGIGSDDIRNGFNVPAGAQALCLGDHDY